MILSTYSIFIAMDPYKVAHSIFMIGFPLGILAIDHRVTRRLLAIHTLVLSMNWFDPSYHLWYVHVMQGLLFVSSLFIR